MPQEGNRSRMQGDMRHSRADVRRATLACDVAVMGMKLLLTGLLIGCGQDRRTEPSPAGVEGRDPVSPSEFRPPSLAAEPKIVRWVHVSDLPKELALLESVFWEPDDTLSLRQKIATSAFLKNAEVLEIGTGSGLISLCCLQAGAAKVVATDLNPAAVQNALLNAREMKFEDRFDARLVPRRSPGAWTVIEPEARFDLIVSNPPWENSRPATVDQFALYDPDFELLKSLVTGARTRLKAGGRMWLAYGCVTAIRRIQEVAAQENLHCRLLDDRSLEALPELFLPGMLIEIRVDP